MHSRKKGLVDQKAKAEEKAKVLKFHGAMQMILSQKKNGLKNIEFLKPISQLLLKCPECLTLWNYRREIFIDLKSKIADCDNDKEDEQTDEKGDEAIQTTSNIPNSSDLSKLCLDELTFIENCLQINPKAYGAWHHRVWLQTFMKDSNLLREIELCNQFLKADERNFHCWDYRRIIAKLSERSEREELEFTTMKIDDNFSNFSAWHYRSSLLTKLYTSSTSTEEDRKFVQETLKNDLMKIQEAIFTDPSDQSSWFYLRWLITVQNNGFDFSNSFQKKTIIIGDDLRQTLDDLRELEPDNKWVNYILAWIRPDKHLIEKLIQIDPLRENFYRHLENSRK